MQVPIRKSGKYTHQQSDPHMTAEKLDELKTTLKRLKESRPQAIKELQRLAEMGDFSENAAYAMAKGRLRGINQRMLELGVQIKSAVVITPTRRLGVVQLGSKVTVEVNGRQSTYLILGSSETNPGQGVISHHSPIGAALMGHRAGESVSFQSASRNVQYLIIKID